MTATRPEIPLTTLFTPPASCEDIVTYDGTTLWQYGISQSGDPDCYPSSFYSILASYYTPGVCPHGWTGTGSSSATSSFYRMCCPSAYTLSHTDADVLLRNVCISRMISPLTNVYSVDSLSRGPIPENPSLTTLKLADVSSNIVYADVLQVRWSPADTEVISLMDQEASMSTASSSSSASKSTPSGPTGAGSAATASPTAAIPAMTSPPTSNTESASTGGLSTGAKAGIGVGVSLGVIAIAALLAFLILARSRRRKRREVQALGADYKSPSDFSQYQPELDNTTQPAEMEGARFGELQGTELRPEMDGYGVKSWSSKGASNRSPNFSKSNQQPDQPWRG